MNLVFMGTPEFAVPALGALYHSIHEIAYVVSQPDRPSGRGKKVAHTPVKSAAIGYGLTVLQPESVSDSSFLEKLAIVRPDYIVVVAFGQMLPESLLGIPVYGVINIHGSLLPAYRGASPVSKAIIDGCGSTGVTTMLVEKKMDAGDMLLQQEIAISNTDTTATLSKKLSELGAGMILPTLDGLQRRVLFPRPQDLRQVSFAPSLKKQEGRISWNGTAAGIDNFVRGMYPWPGAFTFYNQSRWKIIRAVATDERAGVAPGLIVRADRTGLFVAAADYLLRIEEIQPENKKRLNVEEFLKGYTVEPLVLDPDYL